MSDDRYREEAEKQLKGELPLGIMTPAEKALYPRLVDERAARLKAEAEVERLTKVCDHAYKLANEAEGRLSYYRDSLTIAGRKMMALPHLEAVPAIEPERIGTIVEERDRFRAENDRLKAGLLCKDCGKVIRHGEDHEWVMGEVARHLTCPPAPTKGEMS